jgi:hypothetical protein
MVDGRWSMVDGRWSMVVELGFGASIAINQARASQSSLTAMGWWADPIRVRLCASVDRPSP